MLANRRVVLGVSGGVAAYKSVYLARLLVEAGAEVRVVMTAGARKFVGPQSFAAVSGNPVMTELFDQELVSPHTELAEWADLIVVAPATATVLARTANGFSTDLLSALVLAARSPVLFAPAMHTEMWEHPATQRNVEALRGFGYPMVGPEAGALAGGDDGVGRMAEPDHVFRAAERLLTSGPLDGVAVLVAAGGTREPIDPVRYIGNRSSGKMGYAVAEAAAKRGAEVVLVTSARIPPPSGVEVVRVETADEMAEAVWSRAEDAGVVVMAAAVADFRPKAAAESKLARRDGAPDIVLEPTPDILAGIAQRELRPFLVGFAAETGSLDRAVEKAKSKGVDLLVANDVAQPDSGFGTDTNEVSIVMNDGSIEPWPLMTKIEVADRLWDLIQSKLG